MGISIGLTPTMLAEKLLSIAVEMPMVDTEAMDLITKTIMDESKAEIGHYQGAAGPFAAWPPLAESTLRHKAADTPLLETGEMRDSIGREFTEKEGSVGSNSDKAVWQELGTSRGIPPRSFLGHAAVVKSPELEHKVGRMFFVAMVGGGIVVPP